MERKVSATLLAGAIVTILVWLVQTFAEVKIPAEVSSAAVTIIGALVGWFVPNKEMKEEE